MSRYAHILAEITNTPLMVTPAKADAVLAVLHRRLGTDYLLVDDRRAEAPPVLAAEARRVGRRSAGTAGDSIAVVDVIGSLVHRGSNNFGSGLRSYMGIKKDVETALADPEVGGIILDIGSHGGQSEGCLALARWLREASAAKPIIGIARESAYSAGYALLSGCSEAYMTPDGGAGSVGVILVHANQEKFNEKIGVQYTIIYSGARKADFNPHSALGEEAYTKLQAMVDDGRRRFAEVVAAHRKMSIDAVLATEAGIYFGQEAVDVGFVDGLMTWEQTVGRMRELMAGGNTRSAMRAEANKTEDNMTLTERFEALIKGNAEEASAALAELGYVEAASAEAAARQAGVDEGVQLGAGRAVEVIQACRLGGLSLEQAERMIGEGLDGKAAQDMALRLRAAESDKQRVTSTVTDTTRSGKHPLIAAAESLAGNA
jgi:signal peptide peptidase SppA